MFNLANCRLHCSCSRGRCFKRLGPKVQTIATRGATACYASLLATQATSEGESIYFCRQKRLPIGDFRMNIRPLHDRIVAKLIETSDGPAGRLFIPDRAKEKRREGKVVTVSRGKRLEDGSLTPLDVTVGDHILYGKYTGSEIKLAGEEYLIVREDEVLGV